MNDREKKKTSGTQDKKKGSGVVPQNEKCIGERKERKHFLGGKSCVPKRKEVSNDGTPITFWMR